MAPFTQSHSYAKRSPFHWHQCLRMYLLHVHRYTLLVHTEICSLCLIGRFGLCLSKNYFSLVNFVFPFAAIQRRRERASSSFSTFYPLYFLYRRAFCFVCVCVAYLYLFWRKPRSAYAGCVTEQQMFFHKWNNANNIVYMNFKREATASVRSKCSSSWRHQFDAVKKCMQTDEQSTYDWDKTPYPSLFCLAKYSESAKNRKDQWNATNWMHQTK